MVFAAFSFESGTCPLFFPWRSSVAVIIHHGIRLAFAAIVTIVSTVTLIGVCFQPFTEIVNKSISLTY